MLQGKCCIELNGVARLVGVREQRDRCIVHSPSLPAQHDACVSNGVYLWFFFIAGV